MHSSSRCRLVCQPDWPLNIFDQEDVETEHEDDERQNDVWQAVFNNVVEAQKSALHPRLGAMSVHKGQDFPLQGRQSLRQMWKIQQAGQPKAAPRLSWEPVEAEHRGPRESGQPRDTTARSRVAPLRQRGAANRMVDLMPCPIPHGAVCVGGLGRGIGGSMGPFPLVEQRFAELPCLPLRGLGFVHSVCPVIVGPRCLHQKSSNTCESVRR